MKTPFYDIKAQYDELKTELDRVVLEILSSGAYTISGGHFCADFETQFAAAHHVRHAIAVHSGTDALRIIMDAAGIGHGDEVITTAFTFVASVETIVQTGATPVFADIDPRTFHISPEQIREKITPRTKAILPVHLFGQLADVDAISAIADEYNLIVLEDAAQAVFAEHNGVPAGNFGVAGGFSFYVTKNLGAAGDAGLIVTNDDDIADRCRSIRVHGMGQKRYYYDYLGYTSRMDEIQAAVLSVKMTRLAAWTAQRQRFAAIYQETLAGSHLQLPHVSEGNNHTWHQFAVLSEHRDDLQAYLKSKNVDSMIYYPVPIHFHDPYRRFGGGEGSLPQAERVSRQVLCLPIHPHLSEDQVRYAAQCVNEFCSQLKPSLHR